MTATPDLVLLLPGFFGFNRLSGFYYFAERAAAAIRGGLDVREGRPIPVVPLSTLPSSSLADRQGLLISQIRALGHRLGGLPRLHLVGHSAGGVDAYFLTCERRIDGAAWSDGDTAVRRRITSVTTVASPFHGTWLSVTAAARFALDPRHSCSGVIPLIKLCGQFLSMGSDALWRDSLGNALAAVPQAAEFCWHLLRNRKLITDLAPDHMTQLLAANRREIAAQITHFVTVVPKAALRHAAPFFADLYALTADRGGASPASPAVHTAAELLNRHASEAVRPPDSSPPVFDPGVNDGVVNSARQIADPGDRSTFGGSFVADHADVLGYYDDIDALVTGRPLNESVFRSGAGFCDNQFYELYRRVAERISNAMRATRAEPVAVALRGVS
jgi:hypothetical protein